MTRTRYPLPSIAELTEMIYTGWTLDHSFPENAQDESEDAPYMDVRLHTFGSDRSRYGYRDCWFLNFGSPDYDSAHGCAIGANGYNPSEKPTRREAQAIARDLLTQVRDQIAEIRSAHAPERNAL